MSLVACGIGTVDVSVPTTCDAGLTDCRAHGALRWIAPIPTTVGIQSTQEHGKLSYVTPVSCTMEIMSTSTPTDWQSCTQSSDFRFDSQTLWFVSDGTVVGIEPDTGEVVEQSSDASLMNTVMAVPALTDPNPAPDGWTKIKPTHWGMVKSNLSEGTNHFLQVDGTWVFFQVSCLANAVQDIPDAGVSHGAPIFTQICIQPVIIAFNV